VRLRVFKSFSQGMVRVVFVVFSFTLLAALV
jgi:hypothetical protein